MENIDKIMSKVRALFDRAEATTFDGEREACLEAAERLLIKHHLDKSMIDMSESGHHKKPASMTFQWGARYEADRMILMNEIASMFSCRVLKVPNQQQYYDPSYGKYYYQVFGYEADIDLVWSLHELIDSQMMMEMAAMPHSDVTSRKSFIAGYTNTVLDRMREFYISEMEIAEESTPGTEVALASKSDEVDKYMTSVVGEVRTRTRNTRVNDNYHTGAARGADADISLAGSKVGRNSKALA